MVNSGPIEAQQPPVKYNMIVSPGPVLYPAVGQVMTQKVTIVDTSGNLAGSNFTQTISFAASCAPLPATGCDPVTLPQPYTFTAADAGTHSFSFTNKVAQTAGHVGMPYQVLFSSPQTGTSGFSVFFVTSSGPSQTTNLVFQSMPSSVKSGQPFSSQLVAEDSAGNILTTYTGTVSFSSSDTAATLPSSYTFTPADAGRHIFNFALATPGNAPSTAGGSGSPTIIQLGQTISVKDNLGNTGVSPHIIVIGKIFVFSDIPSAVASGVGFTAKVTAQWSDGTALNSSEVASVGNISFSTTSYSKSLPLPPLVYQAPKTYNFALYDIGSQTVSVSNGQTGAKAVNGVSPAILVGAAKADYLPYNQAKTPITAAILNQAGNMVTQTPLAYDSQSGAVISGGQGGVNLLIYGLSMRNNGNVNLATTTMDCSLKGDNSVGGHVDFSASFPATNAGQDVTLAPSNGTMLSMDEISPMIIPLTKIGINKLGLTCTINSKHSPTETDYSNNSFTINNFITWPAIDLGITDANSSPVSDAAVSFVPEGLTSCSIVQGSSTCETDSISDSTGHVYLAPAMSTSQAYDISAGVSADMNNRSGAKVQLHGPAIERGWVTIGSGLLIQTVIHDQVLGEKDTIVADGGNLAIYNTADPAVCYSASVSNGSVSFPNIPAGTYKPFSSITGNEAVIKGQCSKSPNLNLGYGDLYKAVYDTITSVTSTPIYYYMRFPWNQGVNAGKATPTFTVNKSKVVGIDLYLNTYCANSGSGGPTYSDTPGVVYCEYYDNADKNNTDYETIMGDAHHQIVRMKSWKPSSVALKESFGIRSVRIGRIPTSLIRGKAICGLAQKNENRISIEVGDGCIKTKNAMQTVVTHELLHLLDFQLSSATNPTAMYSDRKGSIYADSIRNQLTDYGTNTGLGAKMWDDLSYNCGYDLPGLLGICSAGYNSSSLLSGGLFKASNIPVTEAFAEEMSTVCTYPGVFSAKLASYTGGYIKKYMDYSNKLVVPRLTTDPVISAIYNNCLNTK